jgi:hypothetical protein
MSSEELIARATTFLIKRGIGFVDNAKIGREDGGRIEVIFPVPETLDPDIAFVDPVDVRVWVSLSTDEVELIHQM